ncbi:hypothetical protein KEHDKFFH_03200 [Marinobacter maroccanus]|uniref:Uncharacterized protein n=1 Tax=Marinobacter maroccanus TaxID=2055143 RepID=A0A2S5ZDI6_9GAMM|nr:hypothetical protein [Marinobacter maroccanus]PPI85457.1 hypothetical protein KEHDKFFH_03200 [Marinobacter maroccanus]
MGADFYSRIHPVRQRVVLVLLSLGLSGCKTEKDPDQPTILGVPPVFAYLGVEYSYNFGAYGGEDILDYSLTNAPSWLALEDTSNKARQGIIMRGVPGLTGGSRGEADLGKTEGINLVTTDGRMAGAQPFDIDVKYNVMSLDAEPFTEGESPEIPASNREQCALPDLETEGEHSFTVHLYNDDGSVSGTRDLTLPTRRVYVKVILDQPSVTRVAVAFELLSDYDASSCDVGFSPPHQNCDHSASNAGDAILGEDIVGLGSNSSLPRDETGESELDYIDYEPDEQGFYTRGVITLEPGITECYLPLEVVEDSFPEPVESLRLALTEVRSGLAGLGSGNGGVVTNLSIQDNEPVLTLETVKGGGRDTLNVGDVREYVARLSGDRDRDILAKLSHTEDSTARLDSEFVIERLEEGNWVENDELVFPEGTDEVSFRIRVPAGSYANPAFSDRFILLGTNENFQAGREDYARAESENLIRVSLNELTSPLVLNSGDGFVATDIAVGHDGRLFVAGYDSQDNDRVLVRIFDQRGAKLQQVAISSAGDSLIAPDPVINVVQRKVTQGGTKVDRFEFVVAYSTDQTVEGTTAIGGQDAVTSLYWFDSASNGGEYIPTWTIRTGTDADDQVRWAGINRDTGYVVLAGETNGVFDQQQASGGIDSFLQRIDTELDGNTQQPAVAWSRQAGSAADDRVAGGSTQSISPGLFGSAAGSVEGAPVIGGIDAFFFNASSATSELSVNQVGTAGDEPVSGGLFQGSTLWLIGASDGLYSVLEQDEEDPQLERESLSSTAGFLLGYSSSGIVGRAFSLNDDNDQADETLQGLTAFDGDMVVSGATDGDFASGGVVSGMEQGIVARVSLVPEAETEDEDSGFRNDWRYQLAVDNSEILDLENYRDDEIVALSRMGGNWYVLLFSPEGQSLTPLN